MQSMYNQPMTYVQPNQSYVAQYPNTSAVDYRNYQYNQPVMNQNRTDNQFFISTPNETEEPKPTYISGRYVGNPKEIRPNEVRSDGNPAVFPLLDRSAIITKELNESGTIDTVVYIRQEVINGQQQTPNDTKIILDRLDNIEKMIKKNRYYPKKKEGDENGNV